MIRFTGGRIQKESRNEAMGGEEEEEMSLLCAGHLYIVWILAHLCVLLCALYIYVRDVSERELPIQLGELELYRKQEHTYI